MSPEVALIHRPAIDFDTLLIIADEVLGYSPARGADGAGRELTNEERFISCLAAFQDEEAPPGLAGPLLDQVPLCFLILADDFDAIQILSLTSGMECLAAPTVKSGISALFVTGGMGKWREAVRYGLQAGGTLRIAFHKIFLIFERLGLSDLWSDYKRTPTPDRLFLLE